MATLMQKKISISPEQKRFLSNTGSVSKEILDEIKTAIKAVIDAD